MGNWRTEGWKVAETVIDCQLSVPVETLEAKAGSAALLQHPHSFTFFVAPPRGDGTPDTL